MGTLTSANTGEYVPNYYEPCETASDVYTCTKAYALDPDNIFLATVDGTTYFTKSAIVIAHYNPDDNFDYGDGGILVNDNGANGRDVTAKTLKRVDGCSSYTSFLLGTCTTCIATRTK